VLTLFLILVSQAQSLDTTQVREWQVGGATRQALVYLPHKRPEGGSPLVFAFHGHGGNARSIAAKFRIHELWPEAVVVYPQGLPAPGIYDPEGKQNGWQKGPGDLNDRDLSFFDAMLETLKSEGLVDAKRVYSTGHSNGGGFTYLLWAARADSLTAVAPSAAGSRNLRSLKPIPAMHLAGEQDRLVPFNFQKRTMETVRQVNGCADEGKEWAKGCLIYPSDSGTPFVSFIHSGGHQFPEEAAPLIVRFFQENRGAEVRNEKKPPQVGDLPLVYSCDFAEKMKGWDFTDQAAWRVAETPEGNALDQFQPSEYAPKVRSPVNIALVEGLDLSEFVMEVWAKSTTRDYDHRDVCFFFGHQDPTHFYYSHVAKAGDEHAHSIFLVNGEPRVSIAKERTKGVEWGENWHKIVLVRRPETGAIEVYFDDLSHPVESAADQTFTHGRIGVGTFDDTAQFRDIRIWGRRATP
jgi:polyhydroxybutyrate depolymerase